MSARTFLGDSPAFPNTLAAPTNDGYLCTTGLTKRELFAAMAMIGIVGSIDGEANYQRLRGHAFQAGLKVSEWIARDAAKQADALLAELEKTP
jgi:hypothetical protein